MEKRGLRDLPDFKAFIAEEDRERVELEEKASRKREELEKRYPNLSDPFAVLIADLYRELEEKRNTFELAGGRFERGVYDDMVSLRSDDDEGLVAKWRFDKAVSAFNKVSNLLVIHMGFAYRVYVEKDGITIFKEKAAYNRKKDVLEEFLDMEVLFALCRFYNDRLNILNEKMRKNPEAMQIIQESR